MKVTINFGEEINPAMQRHLETGEKVQDYISAAPKFFNDMLRMESQGNTVRFGDSKRFSPYNTVASPLNYLQIQAGINHRKEEQNVQKNDI